MFLQAPLQQGTSLLQRAFFGLQVAVGSEVGNGVGGGVGPGTNAQLQFSEPQSGVVSPLQQYCDLGLLPFVLEAQSLGQFTQSSPGSHTPLLLQMGVDEPGGGVGVDVGALVGPRDGDFDGDFDGDEVGLVVGAGGGPVGDRVGGALGLLLGAWVGPAVGCASVCVTC